jgi:hypothetical protein
VLASLTTHSVGAFLLFSFFLSFLFFLSFIRFSTRPASLLPWCGRMGRTAAAAGVLGDGVRDVGPRRRVC